MFAVSLSGLLELTASDIQITEKNSQVVYPPGKPWTPHLLRCQGLGVDDYSQTLERLEAAASSTFATLGFTSDFAMPGSSVTPRPRMKLTPP